MNAYTQQGIGNLTGRAQAASAAVAGIREVAPEVAEEAIAAERALVLLMNKIQMLPKAAAKEEAPF